MPRLLFALAAALFVASCNEPPTDFRECPPGVDPGSFDCVFPRPEQDTGAATDAAEDDAGADVGSDAAESEDAAEGSGTGEGSGQVEIQPVAASCSPGDPDCPETN